MLDVVYDIFLETDAACDDDIFEDNDFDQFAANTEPGVYMLRGCQVDADWFSFPVEVGQVINVAMGAFDAECTRYLSVSEPGDGSYHSGTVRDNPLSGQVEVTTDGEAKIRIQFWSDDVDYELTLEVID